MSPISEKFKSFAFTFRDERLTPKILRENLFSKRIIAMRRSKAIDCDYQKLIRQLKTRCWFEERVKAQSKALKYGILIQAYHMFNKGLDWIMHSCQPFHTDTTIVTRYPFYKNVSLHEVWELSHIAMDLLRC